MWKEQQIPSLVTGKLYLLIIYLVLKIDSKCHLVKSAIKLIKNTTFSSIEG